MSESANLSLFLVGIAFAAMAVIVVRNKTVLLGMTIALMFQIGSAGLSAFVYGRIFGLSEYWVSADRLHVFRYCAYGVIAMTCGVALMWWKLRGFGDRLKPVPQRVADAPALPWANRHFAFFCLALGATAMLVRPFVDQIPTLNTAVRLSVNWMKIGVIVAVLTWRLRKDRLPIIFAIAIYLPLAVFNTLASGFSPLSTDLAIPLVLVLGFVSGFNWRSIVITAFASVVLLHMMAGWMGSRMLIRSGWLASFPLTEQIDMFLTTFWSNAVSFDRDPALVQQLLFERIDMSDILEMQVLYQPSIEPFQYGYTIVDGLYALVPRALWPDKPVVAGFAEFISQFTGMVRPEEDQTSLGVPIEFELYANGGPAAVAAGLFLLGLLAAGMERRLVTRTLPLRYLLPLIFALMAISNGVQQIGLVAAAVGSAAGSAYLLARVIEMGFPEYNARLLGLGRFEKAKTGSAFPERRVVTP
jgi:hypothetical protein